MSIYRIDIEYELNIDYEYLLYQHRMTSEMDIEQKYGPNRCYILDIELHSAKIHEKNAVLVSL